MGKTNDLPAMPPKPAIFGQAELYLMKLTHLRETRERVKEMRTALFDAMKAQGLTEVETELGTVAIKNVEKLVA